MTTEIEKHFFDTFGIVPNVTGYELKQVKENVRGLIRVPVSEYPQIADRHYLELIVLHNIYLETKLCHLEVKSLKEEILQDLIYEQQLREIKKDDVSDDLKHQVQAIFEGDYESSNFGRTT